jgi:tetratricopeptide (TPR) repeat protein
MKAPRRGVRAGLLGLGLAALFFEPVHSAPQQLGAADAELLEALTAARSRGQEPALAIQQTAFDRARGLIAAGRYEQAQALQAALHSAVRKDWSALDLSLTEMRLGRPEAAEALLLQQLRLSAAPAELWNQLGLLELARGRSASAGSALARALRLGSENAGLSLARLRLQQGQREAALALFRQGVDRDPPPPWSLAGWALCLLGPEPPMAPPRGGD